MDKVYTVKSVPIFDGSNYYGWSKEIMISLQQKGFKKFTEFKDFEAWNNSVSVKEDQRLRYDRLVDAIKVNVVLDTDQKKQAELDKLDDKFHSDLGRWSAQKAKNEEVWKRDEEMCVGFLLSAISENVRMKVKDKVLPFDIWTALKGESSSNELGIALLLIKQLIQISIEPDEKLTSYINRFEAIIDKLKSMGDVFKIPEIFQVMLLVCALPAEYSIISQSINLVKKEDLTLSYLREKCVLEETRVQVQTQSTTQAKAIEEANILKQSQSRKCISCSKAFSGPARFKSCKECYLSKKKVADQSKDQTSQASLHTVVSFNLEEKKKREVDLWVMDSGTMSHASPVGKEFKNMKKRNILLQGATGDESRSSGLGDIPFQVRDSSGSLLYNISLTNTIFNESLRRKLMSVSKITGASKDTFVLFNHNRVMVIRGGGVSYSGEVIMTGHEKDGLYLMDHTLDRSNLGESIISVNNLPSISSTHELSNLSILHRKYSHMSKEYLLRFARANNIVVDEKEEIDCVSCLKAKMKRKNFKMKPDTEGILPGDEIHSDLAGPITPPSLGGKKYAVLYVDKESDYIFGSTLVQKSECDVGFENVKSHILTQYGNRVKRFVSDGEGTYTSNKFQQMLKSEGIIHHRTPNDTPQRDGLSERKFQTVFNPTRANLYELGLPRELWGEAYIHSIYVLNRMIKKGQEKSAYERLKKKKPDISHIHQFGAYLIYKDNHKIKKLDQKGREGIYVGFDDDSYTYRIYDLDSRKIVRSRDVKFVPNKKVLFEKLGDLVVLDNGEVVEFQQENTEEEEDQFIVDDRICESVHETEVTQEVKGVRIENIGDIMGGEIRVTPQPVSLSPQLHDEVAVEEVTNTPRDDTFAGGRYPKRKTSVRANEVFLSTSDLRGVESSYTPPPVSNVVINRVKEEDNSNANTYYINGAQLQSDLEKLSIYVDDLKKESSHASNVILENIAKSLRGVSENIAPPSVSGVVINLEEGVSNFNTNTDMEPSMHDHLKYLPVQVFMYGASAEAKSESSNETMYSEKTTIDDRGVSENSKTPPPVCTVPSSTEMIVDVSNDNTNTVYVEPKNYEEVLKSGERDQWLEAIDQEMSMLKKLGTYDEEALKPPSMPVVGSKWVFKRKLKRDGTIDKYKARLVAQGFSQVQGVNYNETFAPVASYDTIRFLISLAAGQGNTLDHLDIDSAFLNAVLKEEIYMKLPPDQGGKVVKLIKSIYGLKQAPREWNEDFLRTLDMLHLKVSKSDPCLLIRSSVNGSLSGVLIWVDDNIVFGSDEDKKEIKEVLESKYGVKDLGRLDYFCGLEIDYLDNGVKIHQLSYAKSLFPKYGFGDLKEVNTPNIATTKGDSNAEKEFKDVKLYQSLVGSLNFLVSVSRPDLAYAVSVVSRGLVKPSVLDYLNVVRIYRYLKGSLSYGILYSSVQSELVGFSDASYGECSKTRRSHGGYLFMLNGGAISWKSKLQPLVTLSSTEAEYVALCKAAQHCLWLKKLKSDLQVESPNTIIYEDNTSTIALTKNHAISERSKHIAVRYYFLRDCILNGEFEVVHLSTEEMTADILTKSLGRVKHWYHCDHMGLIS